MGRQRIWDAPSNSLVASQPNLSPFSRQQFWVVVLTQPDQIGRLTADIVEVHRTLPPEARAQLFERSRTIDAVRIASDHIPITVSLDHCRAGAGQGATCGTLKPRLIKPILQQRSKLHPARFWPVLRLLGWLAKNRTSVIPG
jgi:hypothetical protein